MAIMRRHRFGRAGPGDSDATAFGSTGWLFADLMLGLVMAFLVANTVGVLPPPAPPAPPAAPVLETHPVQMDIAVDMPGLRRNDPAAIESIKQQLLGNTQLASRHAGLVLTYGGVNDRDFSRAREAASRVDSVLSELGGSGFVFRGTVYREPFFALGKPPEIVQVDIYLFKTDA